MLRYLKIGPSPSGKATGFGPVIRRFESCRPSHNETEKDPLGLFFISLLAVGDAGFEPGSPNARRGDGALFHSASTRNRAELSEGHILPVYYLDNLMAFTPIIDFSSCLCYNNRHHCSLYFIRGNQCNAT